MAAALAQGHFTALASDFLARSYEQMLAADPARRRSGVYYTPRPIVDAVLHQVLPSDESEASEEVTLLDPACGAGAFLLRAYELRRARVSSRQRLLLSLYGVDLDPLALEVTRLSLLLAYAEDDPTSLDFPDLTANLRCANALLCPPISGPLPVGVGASLDWPEAFPSVFRTGGFGVVAGNPPWGQKEIAADPKWKAYLRSRFPSSAGIFDLFRPFVELSVRLAAPGGRVGLVLPDIVLLKNYAQTRRLLLDSLTLEHIDWWGRAFPAALIDVTTITGRKGAAPTGHGVRVRLHEKKGVQMRTIPQADFRAGARHTFNLHLTAARIAVLRRWDALPRLGDWFEVHEGVHSGNVRAELFVDRCMDETCRELYLGRGEIVPYQMLWGGRYLRSSRLPIGRVDGRYANAGRAEWHEQAKILVRRTGDRVLAALDVRRRYASNNFFLIVPKRPGELQLSGLCAYLNSQAATWYFRVVEPRCGRAFAELKIKHLAAFPLPWGDRTGVARLNALGAERCAALTVEDREPLDSAIDQLVEELLGVRLPEE